MIKNQTFTKQQEFLRRLKDPTRTNIEKACKEVYNKNKGCIISINVVAENETEYAIVIALNKIFHVDAYIVHFLTTLSKYTSHLKIKRVAKGSLKQWAVGDIFFIKRVNSSTRMFYHIKDPKSE